MGWPDKTKFKAVERDFKRGKRLTKPTRRII